MSLFSLRRRTQRGFTDASAIPWSSSTSMFGTATVSNDTALRHSAVWACLRLRADLISTMPVDTFRTRAEDGVKVEVPKPPVLVNPGGERVDILEWMYSTQVDLDRAGNCFGVVSERNALGLPDRIDLANLADVGVYYEDGELRYRIAGIEYPARDIWHEKQYTVAGLDVGLSPVAYAAWSIGGYLSAQQFALDWFGSSAIPAASLKNVERIVPPDQAAVIKERYKATVAAGDLFVHGRDWELKPIQSVGAQTQFIEQMNYGIPDIARFFGVPADMIDSGVSGQSITYANITQRNLQLLITNIGPAVTRREAALSRLLPRPRYVKLNRSALLAMDPATRAATLAQRLASRQITPTEARAQEDLPPFTPADLAEIERVYGPPRTIPTEATA